MEVLQKLKKILNSSNPRVLIIEDNLQIAERIKKIILDPYPKSNVQIPKSYEEAKKYLFVGLYEIVFLDYSLTGWSDAAGTSGIKTIPLIKEANPETFILFISNQEGVGDILVKQQKVDYTRKKDELNDLFEELKVLSEEK